MGIFQDARAYVLLADHIAVDGAGKINALGVGFTIVGSNPQGATSAQSVAAVIDVPARYAGEQYAISLELRDETAGHVVAIASEAGKAEALRVQQIVIANKPQLSNVFIPDSVQCRSQVVLAFPTGLQLTHGHSYQWRLEIEGQHRPGWSADFFVAGPTPGPVLGGPTSASPSDLPSLG